MAAQGKRLKAAYETIDRKTVYDIGEAVSKIKAGARFNSQE